MVLGNSHSSSFFYNTSSSCISSVVIIPVTKSGTESNVHGRLHIGAPLKISFVIIMCKFACCTRQF